MRRLKSLRSLFTPFVARTNPQITPVGLSALKISQWISSESRKENEFTSRDARCKSLDLPRVIPSSHLCGLLANLFTPPLSSPLSSPLIVRGSSRTNCPGDNDADVLHQVGVGVLLPARPHCKLLGTSLT